MLKIVGWAAGVLLALMLVLGVAGWAYVDSLNLDAEPRSNPAATAAELDFVRNRVDTPRGRILAVVSSHPKFDQDRRKAGYELTELARAYWVFLANGYEVDIASPRGGRPPQVVDKDDMGDADYAFLNDADAQAKLADTLPLNDVDASRYRGVYFVGGKGAMFDFPGNPDIARIVRDILPRGVVGAVCHGPAALIDIEGEDGQPLLRGRRVTGFSNSEELFLIKHARTAFPFLLQEKLQAQSGAFVEGPMYLDNTVVDGALITGQNPWSTWSVATEMVRALGHAPVERVATPEEISVAVLLRYQSAGLTSALAYKRDAARSHKPLLLMHALVAVLRGHWVQGWDLQRLARS